MLEATSGPATEGLGCHKIEFGNLQFIEETEGIEKVWWQAGQLVLVEQPVNCERNPRKWSSRTQR